MTLPARYHNLAILIVLVVMCAIVIPRGESDDAYSIDGVSLGMTEAEVQEQWGEVERRDLDDELLVFSIAVASVDRPKAEAWLDGGMVRSVSGRRLFKGTQLLLDPNSTFEQAQELGQPAEIQAPPTVNGEFGGKGTENSTAILLSSWPGTTRH